MDFFTKLSQRTQELLAERKARREARQLEREIQATELPTPEIARLTQVVQPPIKAFSFPTNQPAQPVQSLNQIAEEFGGFTKQRTTAPQAIENILARIVNSKAISPNITPEQQQRRADAYTKFTQTAQGVAQAIDTGIPALVTGAARGIEAIPKALTKEVPAPLAGLVGSPEERKQLLDDIYGGTQAVAQVAGGLASEFIAQPAIRVLEQSRSSERPGMLIDFETGEFTIPAEANKEQLKRMDEFQEKFFGRNLQTFRATNNATYKATRELGLGAIPARILAATAQGVDVAVSIPSVGGSLRSFKVTKVGGKVIEKAVLDTLSNETDPLVNAKILQDTLLLSAEDAVLISDDISKATSRQQVKDILNKNYFLFDDTIQEISENATRRQATQFPDEAIIQEARKYKSAEEFVKAQGDSFYHTTPAQFDKFDKKFLAENTNFNNAQHGFFFTDNLSQIEEFKNVLKEGFGGGFATDGRTKTVAELAKYRTIEKIAKKENFFNLNYEAKDLTPKEARVFADFADKKMGGLNLDGDIVNHKKMTDSQLKKFLKDEVFIEDLDPDSSFLPVFTEYHLGDFIKYLDEKGYDGMVSNFAGGKNEYMIFDPNKFKTKSQLEAIWEEANKWEGANKILREATLKEQALLKEAKLTEKTAKDAARAEARVIKIKTQRDLTELSAKQRALLGERSKRVNLLVKKSKPVRKFYGEVIAGAKPLIPNTIEQVGLIEATKARNASSQMVKDSIARELAPVTRKEVEALADEVLPQPEAQQIKKELTLLETAKWAQNKGNVSDQSALRKLGTQYVKKFVNTRKELQDIAQAEGVNITDKTNPVTALDLPAGIIQMQAENVETSLNNLARGMRLLARDLGLKPTEVADDIRKELHSTQAINNNELRISERMVRVVDLKEKLASEELRRNSPKILESINVLRNDIQLGRNITLDRLKAFKKEVTEEVKRLSGLRSKEIAEKNVLTATSRTKKAEEYSVAIGELKEEIGLVDEVAKDVIQKGESAKRDEVLGLEKEINNLGKFRDGLLEKQDNISDFFGLAKNEVTLLKKDINNLRKTQAISRDQMSFKIRDKITRQADEYISRVNKKIQAVQASYSKELAELKKLKTQFADDKIKKLKIEQDALVKQLGKVKEQYSLAVDRVKQEASDKLAPLNAVAKEMSRLKAKKGWTPEKEARIQKEIDEILDLTTKGNFSGMTTEEANANKLIFKEKYGDNRVMQGFLKTVRDVNKRNLDIMVERGLVSDETAQIVRKAHPDYVPLFRIMDDPEVQNQSSFFANPLKRAVGSDREVSDVIANSYNSLHNTIQRTYKNDAIRSVAKFVQDNSVKGLKAGEYTVDNTNVATMFRGIRNYDGGNLASNELGFFIDGKKKVLQMVNEDAKQVVTGALGTGPFTDGLLGSVLRKTKDFTRFYSGLYTRFSLDFQLPNKIRDTLDSFMVVGSQTASPLRTQANLAKNWNSSHRIYRDYYNGIKNEETAMYKEFLETGGSIGGQAMQTVEETADTLKATIERENSLILRGRKSFIEGVDNTNRFFEESTRFNTYRTLRQQGYSRESAASLSKMGSINFNQHGQVGPVANALYMFFNASVQGTANMARMLRNPTIVLQVTSAMTLATAAQDKRNSFIDPNWKDKVPAYIRARNLVYILGKNPDGSLIIAKIPIPYSLVPINVAMQEANNIYNGRTTVARGAMNLLRETLESASPVGAGNAANVIAPSILDTPVSLAFNQDSLGRPIHTERDKTKKPYEDVFRPETFGDTDKEVAARAISKWFYDKLSVGVSPNTLLYMYDKILPGGYKSIQKTAQIGIDAATGDPLNIDNIVVLRSFVTKITDEQQNTTKKVAEKQDFTNYMKDVGVKEDIVQAAIQYQIDHPEFDYNGTAFGLLFKNVKLPSISRDFTNPDSEKAYQMVATLQNMLESEDPQDVERADAFLKTLDVEKQQGFIRWQAIVGQDLAVDDSEAYQQYEKFIKDRGVTPKKNQAERKRFEEYRAAAVRESKILSKEFAYATAIADKAKKKEEEVTGDEQYQFAVDLLKLIENDAITMESADKLTEKLVLGIEEKLADELIEKIRNNSIDLETAGLAEFENFSKETMEYMDSLISLPRSFKIVMENS